MTTQPRIRTILTPPYGRGSESGALMTCSRSGSTLFTWTTQNLTGSSKSERRRRAMQNERPSALTRRSLLRLAGGAAASAMLPIRLGLAADTSFVMTQLSAYMSGNRTLPGEVIEKAKHHIVDTFAAMISGAELPP